MTRRIGFLAFDGVQALDIIGPADAFRSDAFDAFEFEAPPYEVVIIGLTTKSVTTSAGIVLQTDAVAGSRVHLDTLIVPGGSGLRLPGVAERTATWIQSIAPHVRRLVSVCTGLYGLAPTGLVDGCRVTTHWSAAADIAERHPNLQVDSNAIFTRNGRFYTAAGVTAGIDLALAMIEEDHGVKVALAVARELVVCYKGSDGQQPCSERLRVQVESNGDSVCCPRSIAADSHLHPGDSHDPS